jgi:hypothetical protein
VPFRASLVGCFAAAALAAGATNAPAAAADPAAFRGTLTVTHEFHPGPITPEFVQTSNVDGEFVGTYRLRGRRWRSRFAPPRSYLLTGRGQEELGLIREDVKQGEGGTARLTFGARANGAVRFVRRPNGPRETSGLILRLRPRGRFTLELIPLKGHGAGVPLEYGLNREDEQSCFSTPGTRRGRQLYTRGVFQTIELARCPDEEPSDPIRVGVPSNPTIWGANVWAPPEAGFWQPDICRGRVAALPTLRVCGRVRGSRMKGTSLVGGRNVVGGSRHGYPTNGICAFFPGGPNAADLPPPTDGLYDACSRMDLGTDWNRRTVVRWNLRPTG